MSSHNLGWVALAILISCWINLGFLYFLGFRKLEPLEKILANSRWAIDSKAMWGGGFTGRTYRLNAIAVMIFLPELCQWRGLVDVIDIERIPKTMRRFVTGVYIWMFANVLSMALVNYFLDKI